MMRFPSLTLDGQEYRVASQKAMPLNLYLASYRCGFNDSHRQTRRSSLRRGPMTAGNTNPEEAARKRLYRRQRGLPLEPTKS
jgi:hypothetical protein